MLSISSYKKSWFWIGGLKFNVTPQTQKGPKHEKPSLQEKLYMIFFFFPFDEVNKYIDLSTIQFRVL